MASVLSHSIVGYTTSKVINNNTSKRLLVAVVFQLFYQILMFTGFRLSTPYASPVGHRRFTHSLLFVILSSVFLMFTIGRTHKIIWL